ncbi:MAG: molybdopterin molybdotransferase MoeA [Arcobacteraceae bacterium]|nr:molybdopterin molybdotransferase MoeA [Arcobacteraceae bacterium]
MSISIQEALSIIDSNISKVSFEIVPIENTQNRISAQDVYSTHSLPTFNNSAMDGYGVKLKDTNQKVKVIDTILAGSSKQTDINISQAIKIMTGSRVPASIEAIIPYEQVTKLDDDYILLPNNIKKNQHIRFFGEDIKKEDKILSDGDEINFATVTMLSSQGITHIKVYRQPKISVFTSGEELKLHYEKIEDYQIYNSNTPTLLARAKELGADVTFVGMAKDNIESLKEMISNSLYSDFIITSGGVSVGDADFTKDAFNEFNMEVLFDGIEIKPGKPTVFGKIGNTYILNLPGNPLAAALIFEVFGKIILQKLTGNKDVFHNTIHTKMKSDFFNKKGRTTIVPGFFDGEYFEASEKRMPGMVGVLHNCNSIIILDKHTDRIKKGTTIKIVPINWKFFTNNKKDFFN